MPSATGEVAVCNSCATCLAYTIWHETTQTSIELCLVQDIRGGAFAKASARVSVATADGVRACLGRAESVLICSSQNIARWLLIKQQLVQAQKLYLDRALRVCKEILARNVKDDLPEKFIYNDEVNFNINSTVNLYHSHV